MPSSSSERMRARRALIEDLKEDRRSWLRHGVAALGCLYWDLAWLDRWP